MSSAPSPPKQWYIGEWTGLGWLETIIKFFAHVVAFTALAWVVVGTEFRTWGGSYDLQVIIVGVMALGLTFAIVDRYLEKEIIAMVFVISNVIAHWGMVFALLRQPGSGGLLLLVNSHPAALMPWQLLPIFAGLMLVGDLIKIAFLLRTNFTVRGYNPRVLVYLTGGFVLGYALLLILSLSNPPLP